MSILNRKIGTWQHPISDELDKPTRSASEMKGIFDSNSNELKNALNGLIDDIEDGNPDITFTEAANRTNLESGESLATLLGKIKKFFNDLKGIAFTTIPTNGTSGQFLRCKTSGTLEMEWSSSQGSVTQIQGDLTDNDPTSAAYIRNRPIIATDVSVAPAAFSLDTGNTCEYFQYKAIAEIDGVTMGMNRAEVTFAEDDRWMFAGVCTLAAGGVEIYANSVPEASITIPTIVVWR